MTNVSREVLIGQWYHADLTEKEGQVLIGHIEGVKRYGLLIPYNALPEKAKEIIRAEYDKLGGQR